MLCLCVARFLKSLFGWIEQKSKDSKQGACCHLLCLSWVFCHCPNVLEVSLLSCFPLIPVMWLVIHSFQGICRAMRSCCARESPVCCYRTCHAFSGAPNRLLLVVPIFSVFFFLFATQMFLGKREKMTYLLKYVKWFFSFCFLPLAAESLIREGFTVIP